MTTQSDWKVAIIGAGMAGASAGQALARQGASVVVFDRGRGPGGRCATRRQDIYRFDHGAQYFTARDPRFKDQVASWATTGMANRWHPRIGEFKDGVYTPTRRKTLWVGRPGMNDLARDMLEGLDVYFGTQVQAVDRAPDGWALTEASGEVHASFDQLLVTVPAPQVRPLLQPHYPEACEKAEATMMLPCWSLMLAFGSPVDVPFDAAKVTGGGPVSWAARNSSKPGRPDNGLDCWVVQADHDWSREHIELTRMEATETLLSDFTRLCKQCSSSISGPVYAAAHRWRYAHAMPETTSPCMIEPETGLAVAGDWLSGGRIENAWLSGLAATDALASTKLEQINAATGV